MIKLSAMTKIITLSNLIQNYIDNIVNAIESD